MGVYYRGFAIALNRACGTSEDQHSDQRQVMREHPIVSHWSLLLWISERDFLIG